MATKVNTGINGKQYYRITKTVGRKLNENGIEIPVRKQFYGDSKKAAEEKWQDYMDRCAQGITQKRQYFGIMADNWIYTFLAHDTKLKSRTKELYIGQWNRYMK